MTNATPTISAIETTYGGVRFRSRLEARWAVFFDAVKTPWQYEPEAFHLPAKTYFEADGAWGYSVKLDRDWNYLPDFWLPELKSWFEVKGTNPGSDYWQMLSAFEHATDKRVLVAIGGMANVTHDNDAGGDEVIQTIGDTQYEFCRCPQCGKLGCEFNGRADRICVPGHGQRGGKGYNVTQDIIEAYRTARGYRFWEPSR